METRDSRRTVESEAWEERRRHPGDSSREERILRSYSRLLRRSRYNSIPRSVTQCLRLMYMQCLRLGFSGLRLRYRCHGYVVRNIALPSLSPGRGGGAAVMGGLYAVNDLLVVLLYRCARLTGFRLHCVMVAVD